MAVYGYTKNYKLIKPQFDTDTWHDYEYDNLDTIDAVLSAIFASGDWQGFWKTNTHYDAGGVVIDRDTDTMYKIMVEHTTSEATFAEEFAANPTYYELWSPNNLAEDWAIKMDGQVSNTDYSSKAYAISSALIDDGSAKEWAIGSGEVGDTGEYSAKKYATDAHDDYISMTTDVNVIAVGTNIANVNTVGQSISDVNTVASDISSVNTVAGISTDVTTVASIATAVSNVSGIESEVLDVSDNRTDISTVASNVGDVNTVADISTDVSTVADNDANVTTVATNISDVNTAATNMAAIQAAPTAASNAAASATLAQEWASKMDGQVASTDYSSKYYAGQSATSADNSHVWAEGTDEQVQALGGTHSSKVWAEQSTNANTDLSNLTATGENHFCNPALTNSPYTTNRILEIPQDIKLELSNGTLTLKAGSKVYFPNGFESDGTTPKFDVVVIENDVTQTAGFNTQHSMMYQSSLNNFANYVQGANLFSGATDPTGVPNISCNYNTTLNKMRFTSNGGSSWSDVDYSLPFAISTSNSSQYTSIDQIFNGFGYIGSTVFVLPNVKVQIPDGRNVDGTFDSIIRTLDTVKIIKNNAYTGTYSNVGAFITPDDTANTLALCGRKETGYRYFDDARNCWVYYNDNSDRISINIAYLSITNGKITSFTPYNVDSVANSNASNFSSAGRSFIVSLPAIGSEVSSWTVGATGSTYTASKTGWLVYEHSGLNIAIYIDNKKVEHLSYNSQVVIVYTVRSIYVEKGSTVTINYDGTLNSLTFYNAKGEE